MSFEELKQKYNSAIGLAQHSGHLQNVNMDGDKLFVRAEVPTQDVKNNVWTEIKKADASYSDLSADITVNASLPQPEIVTSAIKTYTIKAGDTLSALALQFYGKASEYNKIFEANRDKMQDANHVKVGEEIVIPA